MKTPRFFPKAIRIWNRGEIYAANLSIGRMRRTTMLLLQVHKRTSSSCGLGAAGEREQTLFCREGFHDRTGESSATTLFQFPSKTPERGHLHGTLSADFVTGIAFRAVRTRRTRWERKLATNFTEENLIENRGASDKFLLRFSFSATHNRRTTSSGVDDG